MTIKYELVEYESESGASRAAAVANLWAKLRPDDGSDPKQSIANLEIDPPFKARSQRHTEAVAV